MMTAHDEYRKYLALGFMGEAMDDDTRWQRFLTWCHGRRRCKYGVRNHEYLGLLYCTEGCWREICEYEDALEREVASKAERQRADVAELVCSRCFGGGTVRRVRCPNCGEGATVKHFRDNPDCRSAAWLVVDVIQRAARDNRKEAK